MTLLKKMMNVFNGSIHCCSTQSPFSILILFTRYVQFCLMLFMVSYRTLFYVITVCSTQKSCHNHKQKSSQRIARFLLSLYVQFFYVIVRCFTLSRYVQHRNHVTTISNNLLNASPEIMKKKKTVCEQKSGHSYS